MSDNKSQKGEKEGIKQIYEEGGKRRSQLTRLRNERVD